MKVNIRYTVDLEDVLDEMSDLYFKSTDTLDRKLEIYDHFSNIEEFREHVILERINIILRDTHTLPSNATKRKRYIKEKIQEDMDRLFAQYPFLKPTKVLSDEIASDADLSEGGYIKRGQGKREGIPELGDERFKVKEGDVILIEDGQFHRVYNTSDYRLDFLCIFTGSRNKWKR